MKPLKTLTITALLASASFTSLQAQELRLGGGYTGSNVQENTKEQWVGRAGYQFGVDVLIGNRLFVKPGFHVLTRNLDYTLLGLGPDGLPNGNNTDIRYKSQSLRIPVLAGIRLFAPSDETDFNLYAMGGPTALIGLDANLSNTLLVVSTNATQWYLGISAGMEYRFLFVEAGYDVAMTNVFQGDGINTNPKVNNSYIVAGLRFLLNK